MSGAAIAMMIVAMLVIWGGLVVAIINLTRGPGVTEDSGRHRDV